MKPLSIDIGLMARANRPGFIFHSRFNTAAIDSAIVA
jgi:hypothetical protein